MENILPWETTVRWMESQLPLLQHIAIVLVYFWVAVLLPMSVFRKLRHLAARCMQASSWYVIALCCWFSVIVVNQFAGWMATTIGLFAGVVGIIPMAIAGSVVEKDWDSLTLLLVGLALILIPRIVAKMILSRGERTRLARVRDYGDHCANGW